MYTIVFTRIAAQDAPKLKAVHLDATAKALLDVLPVEANAKK